MTQKMGRRADGDAGEEGGEGGDDVTLSLLHSPLCTVPSVVVARKNDGYAIVCNDLNHYTLRLITHFDMESEGEGAGGEMGGIVDEVVELYNGAESTKAKYVRGEAGKFLKYGHGKYCLLRVGPFRDLYEAIAMEKYSRLPVGSAITETASVDLLSGAEVSNGKFSSACNFMFYARLMDRMGSRGDEVRDACRNVVKCGGVAGIGGGMREEIREAGVRGGVERGDLEMFYGKVKDSVGKGPAGGAGMAGGGGGEEISERDETALIVDGILDRAAFKGGKWTECREEIVGAMEGKEGFYGICKFVRDGCAEEV